MTEFEKIGKRETNENTALILMLGVLSEKLSEIIKLLSENSQKFNEIKNGFETLKTNKKEIENKKFYMPLTTEDYD